MCKKKKPSESNWIQVFIMRTLQSEMHTKSWEAFEQENLLKFRCQAAAGCKIISNIFLMAAGRESFQVAKEYMDTMEEPSIINDSFKSWVPTIKIMLIMLNIARIGIFVIGFKRPKACRVYFYLEITISLLTALAPRNAFQDWDFMVMAYV